MKNYTIATLGSHSALDICYGAKKYGFKTLVIAQKGREKTYNKYYKSIDKTGCVDNCLVLDKFEQILNKNIQKELLCQNAIFIPHRSFEVYLNFNYKAIEEKFNIPIFGNRFLLKIEERGRHPNQYDLLKKAKIRIPKIYIKPKEIDRLCLVKILEKERGFERAFFLVNSYKDYQYKIKEKLKKVIFTKKQLKESIIEEYITGIQVNFNFFYSPLKKEVELLGTDTRRQTNIEGILKTPSIYQKKLLNNLEIKYEEAGHIAVSVLESMLEQAYDIAERFISTSQKLYFPGIIGPFAIQSIITPGPPRKYIIVVDISPRVPGSPGIFASPYSRYRYGRSITVGERIAIEIKNAIKQDRLDKVLT